MEGALWGLLGWKGPDPEVQDAVSTADLAEGARGTEQSPDTPWALLCPALGSEHSTDPSILSEGALYTCSLLLTAHTVPILLCAALQAVLGSQPGGRVPPQ